MSAGTVGRALPVKELLNTLGPKLGYLSKSEQPLALQLFRSLARGYPVRVEQLATETQKSPKEIAAMLSGGALRGLVLLDEEGAITGFGGLSVTPTPHAFRLDGVTLHTWCALDAFFIPGILGVTAAIESTCPQSGRTLRVTVSPNGVEDSDPKEQVMSFVDPIKPFGSQSVSESMCCFCDHVRLIASRAEGNRWCEERKDAFLLTLQQAFELGTLYNAARFGDLIVTGGPKLSANNY